MLVLTLWSTSAHAACPPNLTTQQMLTCLNTRLEQIEGRGIVLEGLVDDHEARVVAIEADYVVSSDLADLVTDADVAEVKELEAYVTVDPVAQKVTFHDVNVHIENGSGLTSSNNGTGNLVVGYDADDGGASPDVKDGSHNVVIGDGHTYTSTASLIAGTNNYAHAASAFVAGGANTVEAMATGGAICGGGSNRIGWTGSNGVFGTVCGGQSNTTLGDFSTVVGGGSNVSGGNTALVAGGLSQTASGTYETVVGP